MGSMAEVPGTSAICRMVGETVFGSGCRWSLTSSVSRSTTDLVVALLMRARAGLAWAGLLGRRINARLRSASLARWRSGTAIAPGVDRDSQGVFDMLKLVLKKSMLLLGAVLASCAFVLPSVASAASWSPVGTTDGRIDSGNLGFSIPATGSGTACTASSFSVTVHSAAVATITGASFANCHGDLGSGAGCTLTTTVTNLPWRATPVTTNDIIIHGVDIDVSFEQTPGTLGECAQNGLNMRLTGSVTASFTPGAVGSRRFDFGAGPMGAFITHIPGVGSLPAVPRGQATATGLLNVVD